MMSIQACSFWEAVLAVYSGSLLPMLLNLLRLPQDSLVNHQNMLLFTLMPILKQAKSDRLTVPWEAVLSMVLHSQYMLGWY